MGRRKAMVAAFTYGGIIERVIDGDTIVVLVDLGFKVFKRVHVRLARIDAPEGRKGRAVTNELTALISKTLDGGCVVKTEKPDKYGRTVGEVEVETTVDGKVVNLSDYMLKFDGVKLYKPKKRKLLTAYSARVG